MSTHIFFILQILYKTLFLKTPNKDQKVEQYLFKFYNLDTFMSSMVVSFAHAICKHIVFCCFIF